MLFRSNDLSFKDWLIHLQEELLDGAGYIQKLIEEIDEQKQTVERNQNNTEQS